MTPTTSPLLRLPAELLRQIAHYACPPELRYPFTSERTQSNLFNFRLTCKALERASFDFLIKAYPEKIRIRIDRYQPLKNFKAQTSLRPLAEKLKEVTLTIDTVEVMECSVEPARSQAPAPRSSGTSQRTSTQYPILEICTRKPKTEIRTFNFTHPEHIALLSSLLSSLQTLPTPPKLSLQIARFPTPWYIRMNSTLGKPLKPQLAAIMDAIPFLHKLEMSHNHYDPQALLNLLKRSRETIESLDLGYMAWDGDCEVVKRELMQCTRAISGSFTDLSTFPDVMQRSGSDSHGNRGTGYSTCGGSS